MTTPLRRLGGPWALAAVAIAPLPAGAVKVPAIDPAVARLRAQMATVARTVPDVLHLSCNDAQRKLEAAMHRSVQCQQGDAIAGFDPDTVNRQVPAQGEPIRLMLKEPVLVFMQPPAPPPPPRPPPRLVVAPALVGKPEEEARRELAQPAYAAIRLVFVDEPRASQGRRVATQDPLPEARMARGDTLTITFGLSVPYLHDLTCDEATARGAAYGFQVSCHPIDVDAGDARDGLVQGQSPTPSDQWLAHAERL